MGRAFAARHGARLGTFRPPGIRQACAPEAAGHCRHQWPCAGWRIGTCHHRGHSYLRGSGQDWSARMRARNDPWLVRYSAPGPAIGRQRSATPREESRHGRNRFSDRLSIHSEPYCGGGGRWQARALRKNGTPSLPILSPVSWVLCLYRGPVFAQEREWSELGSAWVPSRFSSVFFWRDF